MEGTLHEPYETLTRQREATALGMWVFLASEILLFGGLFFAYVVHRHTDGAAFVAAARRTDPLLGTINTAVLLTSSLAVAVAARAVDEGRPRLAALGLWATIALASAFLGIKAFEYHKDLAEHLWPGARFALTDPRSRGFFGLYWISTGLHACHILIGIGLTLRLAWLAQRGELLASRDSMETTSLYWGLVDMIWVMLFPCLYLVGR